MNFLARIKKFAATLTENHLDGFIITHPPNLRYLCGYTGSNGLLLFLGKRPVFFTDGRYTEQAKAEVEGARVVIAKASLLEAAGKVIGQPILKPRRKIENRSITNPIAVTSQLRADNQQETDGGSRP